MLAQPPRVIDHHADQQGIGVIVPYDFALDRELWRWVPPDVTLHITRQACSPGPMDVEMALACGDPTSVGQATAQLRTTEPRVVTYACASASCVRGATGEQEIRRLILDAGAPLASTTSGAMVEAMRSLGVERVAIGTPYIGPVTERLVAFLAEHGIRTTATEDLGLISDIWRLRYREVVELAWSLDTEGADAVYLSCTNMPTFDVVEPLELATGLPVLTANQVTMWAALRAMGKTAVGGGRLLAAETPELEPEPDAA